MTTRAAFRKTSLIDYPGCISAVIFFPGCNLRCPWCHNRELALGSAFQGDDEARSPYITLEDALTHLEKRRKVLGGVVLSGGEPCLFPNLGELIRRIKSLELKVKLDTNGLFPGALEKLFGGETTRPDYIAMDLKTSPERYSELLPRKAGGAGTNRKTPLVDAEPKHGAPRAAASEASIGESLARSAELIRASGIPHEFRSLLLPADPAGTAFFGEDDRAALALLAKDSPWHIRPFVPGNCLDPAWDNLPATVVEEAAAPYSQTKAP